MNIYLHQLDLHKSMIKKKKRRAYVMFDMPIAIKKGSSQSKYIYSIEKNSAKL